MTELAPTRAGRAVDRVLGSRWFMFPFICVIVTVVVFCVPIVFSHESPRKTIKPADIERVQGAVPVVEQQSVIVYGDSRGAFFGDGLPLVPGWSPVVNEGREGCAFLGADHIWKSYGTKEPIRERNTSKQSTGETVSCDTRTYIPSTERYDIAIVYAGTLFTVNNGATSNVLPPTDPLQRNELLINFVTTLNRINAEHIVILGTPISTNRWDAIGEPYWDDLDRIAAVNAILADAAMRTDATYVPGFADWVNAQPTSCQPDGGHMTIECARDAGLWLKGILEAPNTMVADASEPAQRNP